jgi:cysteine desulfurase/selenocysteine lyase
VLTPAHKLVALAHVSNVLGSVLDVERAVALAKSVGAKVLIDGCQAVPRLKVDVAALGCDFYVFSAHKLYGPTGIGALWAKAEILDAMPPWQGGGSMIDRVTFEKTTWPPRPPVRGGHPAIVEAIGFAEAVDYCRPSDWMPSTPMNSRWWTRCAASCAPSTRSACSGPITRRASFLSMDGVHPHDLGTILDEEGVAIRAGHHCAQPLMDHLGVPATARASFGLYSDESDIAALLRGIERTKRIFG